MDMVNIAICDDNIEHISALEKYLFEISNIKIECDAYLSGESLVDAYKNNIERYDVVFLDMEMRELNGIETANLIREFDEHIIIVFVTSHSEYMKESFQCQPFRFIEKPLDYDELKKVFYDIKDKLSKKERFYRLRKTKRRSDCFAMIYYIVRAKRIGCG
ncbi:MAG TPA: response regulator [Candidatus Ornithomonoglobus intestinigallinarum]|uniref:Stage 0 sporulation protein A homolog n=1 Tax=Candidatus Ornithomonoglobus intestinigallinarum TaxID=2840894 RepID=A0A9D1H270_9FIRM|nr:response regulator [Candidatus Ornithomonoglobus intestinigallinarum]